MAEARQKGDFATLASLTPALRSNYGGHVNHSIYWQNLTPNPVAKPPRKFPEYSKNSLRSFFTIIIFVCRRAGDGTD